MWLHMPKLLFSLSINVSVLSPGSGSPRKCRCGQWKALWCGLRVTRRSLSRSGGKQCCSRIMMGSTARQYGLVDVSWSTAIGVHGSVFRSSQRYRLFALAWLQQRRLSQRQCCKTYMNIKRLFIQYLKLDMCAPQCGLKVEQAQVQAVCSCWAATPPLAPTAAL